MRRLAALALTVASIAACDKKSTTLGPGVPASTLAGASGFAPGLSDDGSVIVELLAPDANAVLKASTNPEVRARVRSAAVAGAPDAGGLRAIAPDSVKLALFADGQAQPALAAPLRGPEADGQYAARLDLAGVATGTYRLRVEAATLGGSRGVADRTVLVDHGPRVQVLSPGEGSSYKGSMAVVVLVDYAPFGPGATPVQLTVGGKPGPALAPAATGPALEALVSFDAFSPALEGEQLLRVVATNDQGTTTEQKTKFVVDVTGPAVAMTEPAPGAVVGGVVRVWLVATDPAGVLGGSVRAIVGNNRDVAYELALEPEDAVPGAFSALFDTRKLTRCGPRSANKNELCLIWPNLSFRVADRLGNERTIAYDFGVDNQPPLIDLDPKPVYPTRIKKTDAGINFECAVPFEPIGGWSRDGDMPDDGCAVPQVFDLRAYIEDQSNYASGLKNPPIALVDPTTVAAYVHTDVAQPLVVDTNGDGVCDAINPKLVPTTRSPRAAGEVLKVRLAPVLPAGTADFTPHALDGFETNLGCVSGTDEPAKAVCRAFGPKAVIGYYRLDGPWPAVYGLEPISQATEPACAGVQFDTFANAIESNRWVCLAVAAVDNIGNASVSAPMRLFVGYKGEAVRPRGGACPLPPADAPAMPGCTGVFDSAKGQIVPGTCMPPPERFPGGQFRVDL